ncbi:hypothetical protein M405DRAFT_830012 [Rhizopogon salebrosus TDB-379]|nr:hypothetical protein M405DRAFT_830012 [Rhizopogon salebrosus TDB-379]
MRSIMQPIVERHKVKLQRGHKAPKSVIKDNRRRSPLRLCKNFLPVQTNRRMR